MTTPPHQPTLHGLVIAAGTILGAATLSHAQTYPPGFTGTDLLDSSFAGATAMAVAPDGRVYMTEQGGAVRVWDPANGPGTHTFATFSVEAVGERGLIGIALDPNWSVNRHIYVHYSRAGGAGPIIKRVAASAANPNTVIAGSEVTLVDLGPYATSAQWHVGGGMRFGPDAMLYVGLGDNGDGNHAQSLSTLFGKVLRINPVPGDPIPVDNPTSFSGIPGTTSGNNRLIWTVGLRNPFTLDFHPTTGRFFINDVGQTDWEEIDDGVAGANYGWPETEGDFSQAQYPNYTRPFHAYVHGDGFCITGARFYRPPEHTLPPDYHGDFFFADYIMGWIRRIDTSTRAVTDFATGLPGVVDTATDAQGRLLVLCNGTPARLVRISYDAPLAPTILTHPVTPVFAEGQPARFTVYAAGSRPLAYQWRRDSQPLTDGGAISGATTATLVIADPGCGHAGLYDCVVSNTSGTATSDGAPLAGSGQPPIITQQPAPVLSCVLGSATFTCAATGATSFTWHRVGQPAPIATGPTLILTSLQEHDAGFYYCRVAGACGSVETTPAPLTICYANCDCSTASPVLNFADFTCFLQRFAVGHRYANCDGSTAEPRLNVADFTCFLSRFAAGCPQ